MREEVFVYCPKCESGNLERRKDSLICKDCDYWAGGEWFDRETHERLHVHGAFTEAGQKERAACR